MVDADVMIEKLTELVNELENAPGKFAEDAPRIVFAGRALAIGDYTVPRVFEESGGVIVAEMLDEGVRAIDKDVELEGDLLSTSPATATLTSCPSTCSSRPGSSATNACSSSSPITRRTVSSGTSSHLTRFTTWSMPALPNGWREARPRC